MSGPVQRPTDDPSPPTMESEAISMLSEALCVFLGPKEATRFLRTLAVVMAESGPSNIVNIRDGARDTEPSRKARVWLRERLSAWLMRCG